MPFATASSRSIRIRTRTCFDSRSSPRRTRQRLLHGYISFFLITFYQSRLSQLFFLCGSIPCGHRKPVNLAAGLDALHQFAQRLAAFIRHHHQLSFCQLRLHVAASIAVGGGSRLILGSTSYQHSSIFYCIRQFIFRIQNGAVRMTAKKSHRNVNFESIFVGFFCLGDYFAHQNLAIANAGWDVAWSEADMLFRRASSLGENLREDASHWQTDDWHQKDDCYLVGFL